MGASGGPRSGGNSCCLAASALAAFCLRCLRICSITFGSSILAITLIWPPQCSQTSMSILNTRLRRCVISRDGMYAGFAGAKTGLGHSTMSLCGTLVLPIGIGWFSVGLLAALGRCDLNPVFAVGRENTMEPREVDARLGHQCPTIKNTYPLGGGIGRHRRLKISR